MALSRLATFSVSEDQVSTQLDGQTLLLQMSSGTYFGLNAVGSLVWKNLQDGSTFDQLVQVVMREYDAEENRVRADVEKLLSSLLEQGLIRAVDERPS